jgi:hypothetical protein
MSKEGQARSLLEEERRHAKKIAVQAQGEKEALSFGEASS